MTKGKQHRPGKRQKVGEFTGNHRGCDAGRIADFWNEEAFNQLLVDL